MGGLGGRGGCGGMAISVLLLLDFGGPGGSRDGVEDRGTRAREEGRRSAVVIVRMRKMA